MKITIHFVILILNGGMRGFCFLENGMTGFWSNETSILKYEYYPRRFNLFIPLPTNSLRIGWRAVIVLLGCG